MVEQSRQLRTAVEQMLNELPSIEGWFYSGSIAAGTDDEWSDTDIVATASSVEGFDNMVNTWQAALEARVKIIYFNRIALPDSVVFNHISVLWERVDVQIYSDKAAAELRRIPGGGVVAPGDREAKRKDGTRFRDLTVEFIRVLGLLPVCLGRADPAVGVSGVQLLRNMLILILIDEVPVNERGGALHLRKILSLDSYSELTSIPDISAEAESVTACHVDIARKFLARARSHSNEIGWEFPEEFLAATVRHLSKSLGLSL